MIILTLPKKSLSRERTKSFWHMEERFVFLEYTTLLISIEIENLIYTTVSCDKSSVNGRINSFRGTRISRELMERVFPNYRMKNFWRTIGAKKQHCILYRTRSFHELRSCKFFRTFPPFLFFAFPFNGISRMGAIKTPSRERNIERAR